MAVTAASGPCSVEKAAAAWAAAGVAPRLSPLLALAETFRPQPTGLPCWLSAIAAPAPDAGEVVQATKRVRSDAGPAPAPNAAFASAFSLPPLATRPGVRGRATVAFGDDAFSVAGKSSGGGTVR